MLYLPYKKSLSILFTVFAVAFLGGYGHNAYASTACKLEVAHIVSMQGIIELRRAQETNWQSVSMNTTLCAGDMIRARSQSRAALRLSNHSMLRLDQKTSITFPALQEDSPKLRGTAVGDAACHSFFLQLGRAG